MSPAGLALTIEPRLWSLEPHLDLLNTALVDAVMGVSPYLIVEMPPRHGKSELCSRFTPPWFLGLFPDKRVMLASYEADFAASWGRKGRDILDEHGPSLYGVRLRQDSSAAARWDVEARVGDRWVKARGGMVTAGVGGPFTGKGADLLIIDDPVKNAEESLSKTHREKAWDWWRSTARTRLEPGGAVVLIMTRWHMEDLAGRMQAEMLLDADAMKWRVIRLPAFADEDDDAIGRKIGDPLWPGRYGTKELEAIRKSVQSYWWHAMYQQRPIPPEGAGMFRREAFVLAQASSADGARCRMWDFAATSAKDGKDPDWTAGALVVRGRDGRWWIEDIQRMRGRPGQVEELVRQTAARDTAATAVYIEQEPGASGKALIDYYTRQVLQGYSVRPFSPTGDKETRARIVSSQADAGNVMLVEGNWVTAFLEECESFPMGSHDDMVDAVSGAFAVLASKSAEMYLSALAPACFACGYPNRKGSPNCGKCGSVLPVEANV